MPVEAAGQKIKKTQTGLTLQLQPTPDIVETIAASADRPQLVVGFAAESEDLIGNARRKLVAKKLDLIVANNIVEKDSGFGADTNHVIIIGPDDFQLELPLMSKWAVASAVLDEIAKRLQ